MPQPIRPGTNRPTELILLHPDIVLHLSDIHTDNLTILTKKLEKYEQMYKSKPKDYKYWTDYFYRIRLIRNLLHWKEIEFHQMRVMIESTMVELAKVAEKDPDAIEIVFDFSNYLKAWNIVVDYAKTGGKRLVPGTDEEVTGEVR